MSEKQGVNDIEHVSLYTNVRGADPTIDDSDTYIRHHRPNPVEVNDPNNFFSEATFAIKETGATEFILEFNLTFAKPMDTSHLMLMTWDIAKHISKKTYLDVITVEPAQEQVSIEPEPLLESTLPDWIKFNAGWWAQGQISDSEFITGIKYLLETGVITIPETTMVSEESQEIPEWIRSNAGWWSDGLITSDDFVQGIQWLVSNGVIKL